MQGRTIWQTIAVVAAFGLAAAGPARAQVEEAAPPPAAPSGDQPLGEEEAMVLNFERADIREVIHSLATALGISYTIDPRIEGQVTIRTNGKIAREDLFPLFNQILRNNGIAAVKVGDIYQILPVAEAKTRAIVPPSTSARQGARANDSFVIEIFPVRHVSSDEMVNILQPFVTPGVPGTMVMIDHLHCNSGEPKREPDSRMRPTTCPSARRVAPSNITTVAPGSPCTPMNTRSLRRMPPSTGAKTVTAGPATITRCCSVARAMESRSAGTEGRAGTTATGATGMAGASARGRVTPAGTAVVSAPFRAEPRKGRSADVRR